MSGVLQRTGPARAPDPTAASRLDDRPYKGLQPYTEADADFFFGRSTESRIIAANLKSSRLTLLYGPSGVGKTSLLRAGVSRQLMDQAAATRTSGRPPRFVVVVFDAWRESDPLCALKQQIRDAVEAAVPDARLQEMPEDSLADTLYAWTRQGQTTFDLLVVLDQFEEYFLYHPDDIRHEGFATQFAGIVNRAHLRVNTLLSIREDRLAALDVFKTLIPRLMDNFLRIEHLDRLGAQDAIVQPVKLYNERLGTAIAVDDDLVGAVLDQVPVGKVTLGRGGRGAIGKEYRPQRDEHIEAPFLQLVMTRVWDEELSAGSGRLRRATFERLGGASSIAHAHLELAMARLGAREQEIAAVVFDRLVTPGGTKIAQSVGDLVGYIARERRRRDRRPRAEQEVLEVLRKLSLKDFRILREVPALTEHPDDPRFEIFHDILAAPVITWQQQYAADTARRRRWDRYAVRFGTASPMLGLTALPSIAFGVMAMRRPRASKRSLWRPVVGIALSVLSVLGWSLVLWNQVFELRTQCGYGYPSCIAADSFTLGRGECFQHTPVIGITSVTCDEQHDAEVIASVPWTAAETNAYPKEEEFQRFGDESCLIEFERYVGEPYVASPLGYGMVIPTPGAWQSGEHDMVCFLYDPYESLEGSQAGTGDTARLQLSVEPVGLAVGDCIRVEDGPGQDQIVSCDERHDAEIIAHLDYPAVGSQSYPARVDFNAFGTNACMVAFEVYTGTWYYESKLHLNWLPPSDAAWDAGERGMVCYAHGVLPERSVAAPPPSPTPSPAAPPS